MGRAIEVPITPSVLKWAVNESGFDLADIAHAVDVAPETVQGWITGTAKPRLTEVRKLASKLHRPFAAFLLPAPPKKRSLFVQFRHPMEEDRGLNPTERRYLRKAARMQELLSWLAQELNDEKPTLHPASVSDDPVRAAQEVRTILGVSSKDQQSWTSPSTAFDAWRQAVEHAGVLVFLFPMGQKSCRGFSLWGERAPVIAVNTAWNESARIFTLFHEMGHLVSRTSSACSEVIRTGSKSDPVERWAERFAAGLLLPEQELLSTLRRAGWQQGSMVTSLATAKTVANTYKVSLRAAVVRLVELKVARWSLYDQIPPISDQKPLGGGGGGRDRTQIREDQFGMRATSLFVTAVDRDILDRSQAVGFLDIPDAAFDQMAQVGGSR